MFLNGSHVADFFSEIYGDLSLTLKTPLITEHQDSKRRFVDAKVIAKIYSVTPRYVLQLAAEGRIPHLRLGHKCVRFSENEVAKVLEGTSE
jgi:excisionase family DNA binding protein